MLHIRTLTHTSIRTLAEEGIERIDSLKEDWIRDSRRFSPCKRSFNYERL